MNNEQFLNIIACSFRKFLTTGSRSNEKLKILHKAIAEDIVARLETNYSVKSLGIDNGKEETIYGKYIDKKVDITILKNDVVIAGIGVKFVMQNYSQNSNNYFENMLGETANIRCANTPYFQIFIIPEELPYYDSKGNLKKWETFSKHNSSKYLILSRDNIDTFVHTPNKTLLFVVRLPEVTYKIKTRQEYINYYSGISNLKVEKSIIDYGSFSNAVIYNDYEEFAKKVMHTILSV